MAGSRELKNLAIDGTAALSGGAIPNRSTGNSYRWKGGARYENAGSAQDLAWAAEAARTSNRSTATSAPPPEDDDDDDDEMEDSVVEAADSPASVPDEVGDVEMTDAEEAEQPGPGNAGDADIAAAGVEGDSDDEENSDDKDGHDEDNDDQDDDDEEDAAPKCNDPSSGNGVTVHGEAELCEGGYHGTRALYNCEADRNSVFATASKEQQEVAEHGAADPLCRKCGDDPLALDVARECRCLTKPLCGQCLLGTLDDLVDYSKSVDLEICHFCQAELDGSEKMTMCLICRGLKVRW
ncbi:hypothetical protein B0A55_03534 [Friedmanniomyces simplex]|uniref:Uncharacterized protein n=1 Tax=Friedmanniomyces simplex TaxID=329884 RepID=A0A4U0XHK5_9PEZI|nr:hypothetical protein B0A55_03534 [Friedmanniomyces simplex]